MAVTLFLLVLSYWLLPLCVGVSYLVLFCGTVLRALSSLTIIFLRKNVGLFSLLIVFVAVLCSGISSSWCHGLVCDCGISWPRGYKLVFMLNSTEHEIRTAHKNEKYRQMKKFLALSLSDVVFIMLINVKSQQLSMKNIL